MRRLAVGAVILVVAFAAPALADEGIEELLEGAMAGDVSGEGIVMSSWAGLSAATFYEVSRSGGMEKVSSRSEETVSVGKDGLTASKSGGEWYGFRVEEWSEWTMSDRYRLGSTGSVTHLGRSARQVDVLEGELLRVRLVVDATTAVPLMTEVYAGDGTVYRTAALIDLGSMAQSGDDAMPEMHEMETMEPMAPPEAMPSTLAGYSRADAYGGPGDMAQVFYSDGLFSFSVFEWRRGPVPDEFVSAAEIELAGDTYRVRLLPTQIWVFWNAPDDSYVLVGDLPPDHLEAVLGELPEPGNRAWPIRLWRWLFG